MKHIVSIALLSWLTLQAFPAIAEESEDAKSLSKCDIGPVMKTYGQGKWLVYSGDDEMTLLVLAAPDNPVKPFMFVLEPGGSGESYGVFFDESLGKNDATAAALAQLKALSDQDVANLIKETKTPGK